MFGLRVQGLEIGEWGLGLRSGLRVVQASWGDGVVAFTDLRLPCSGFGALRCNPHP